VPFLAASLDDKGRIIPIRTLRIFLASATLLIFPNVLHSQTTRGSIGQNEGWSYDSTAPQTVPITASQIMAREVVQFEHTQIDAWNRHDLAGYLDN
jgi:hypothetical protein